MCSAENNNSKQPYDQLYHYSYFLCQKKDSISTPALHDFLAIFLFCDMRLFSSKFGPKILSWMFSSLRIKFWVCLEYATFSASALQVSQLPPTGDAFRGEVLDSCGWAWMPEAESFHTMIRGDGFCVSGGLSWAYIQQHLQHEVSQLLKLANSRVTMPNEAQHRCTQRAVRRVGSSVEV